MRLVAIAAALALLGCVEEAPPPRRPPPPAAWEPPPPPAPAFYRGPNAVGAPAPAPDPTIGTAADPRCVRARAERAAAEQRLEAWKVEHARAYDKAQTDAEAVSAYLAGHCRAVPFVSVHETVDEEDEDRVIVQNASATFAVCDAAAPDGIAPYLRQHRSKPKGGKPGAFWGYWPIEPATQLSRLRKALPPLIPDRDLTSICGAPR